MTVHHLSSIIHHPSSIIHHPSLIVEQIGVSPGSVAIPHKVSLIDQLSKLPTNYIHTLSRLVTFRMNSKSGIYKQLVSCHVVSPFPHRHRLPLAGTRMTELISIVSIRICLLVIRCTNTVFTTVQILAHSVTPSRHNPALRRFQHAHIKSRHRHWVPVTFDSSSCLRLKEPANSWGNRSREVQQGLFEAGMGQEFWELELWLVVVSLYNIFMQ